MRYLMVFGCFRSVSLRSNISLHRGRVRRQKSAVSVSDWESEAESGSLFLAGYPRPAPWLTPSILQWAWEGDNKWKCLKFPTEYFLKHSLGKQEAARLIGPRLHLWMCSLLSARKNLLTALLDLKKARDEFPGKQQSLPITLHSQCGSLLLPAST